MEFVLKLGRRYECSIFRASILLQGYKRDVAAEVAAGQHTRNTQTAELSRIDLEKKARELDACAGCKAGWAVPARMHASLAT